VTYPSGAPSGEGNGASIYDNAEDLKVLRDLLVGSEELEAVFSRPEDSLDSQYIDEILVLGITTRRLIIKESTKRWWGNEYSGSVREHSSLTSIPFRTIYQLRFDSESRLLIMINSTKTDSGIC
jgi:hypothetical protein